ncbi:MAG: carbon-nitrogen hydrolase family protein [Chloroflexota bacterium]
MKATICELPNDRDVLSNAWLELVKHVTANASEMVILPEMPFFRWLPHTKEVNVAQWEEAVQAHVEWMQRLDELAPATVISTRPIAAHGKRSNVGYVWESGKAVVDAHVKYYLPDEPAFWEATWYARGEKEFSSVTTNHCKVGFLICTELWFNAHTREYGKQGIDVLACPRGTPSSTTEKWIAGGRTAAVVSGAFCLSSNLTGRTGDGRDFGGRGWIIDPEGNVLGLTSTEKPFLTLDLDLVESANAKQTYPRYVLD